MWEAMSDEKERVNWSALMEAHGMSPDADTASPAVEPSRRVEADEGEPPPARPKRLVHVIVAVCALFSIAASAAVLIAILRGGGDRDERASSAAADEPVAPVGPRPSAFEQTSDGVTVVPPAGETPPPAEPAPGAAGAAPAAEPQPAAVGGGPRAAPAKPAAAPATRPKAGGDETAKAKETASAKETARAKDGAAKAKETAEAKDGAAEAEPAPAAAGPADPNLPELPDMDGVAAAMAKLEKDIAACAAPAKVSGEVGIKMRIDPDGSVPWASAKVQNTPFQACLDRLFKKARMPKSQKGATVRQMLDLP